MITYEIKELRRKVMKTAKNVEMLEISGSQMTGKGSNNENSSAIL